MEYDKDKIDDMVLALLYLTTFDDSGRKRAWKDYDWDALQRLYEKGYINDPKSKARSIVLSEEGAKKSDELFSKYFVIK